MSLIEKKAADLGVDLAVAAAEESKWILGRLLGPLATEIGERLALSHRERRMVKSYEMLTRVEAKIKEHQAATGAEQVLIPARGAVPLLEAASLEDDPSLAAMYEELLANAATGTGTNDLASFTEIVRQFSPLDAQLMQEMFNQHILKIRERYLDGGPDRPGRVERPHFDLAEKVKTGRGSAVRVAGLPDVNYFATAAELRVSVDNLFRLGLLKDVSTQAVSVDNEPPFGGRFVTTGSTLASMMASGPRTAPLYQPSRKTVVLSDLGFAFMQAVNSPSIEIPNVETYEPRGGFS